MGYVYPRYSLVRVGSLVAAKRTELNIEFASLGNLLGITEERLHRIEDGKAALSHSELVAISDFINVPFDELTTLVEAEVGNGRFRTTVPSEAAQVAIKKAQFLFIELVGQAQLRR